MSNVFDIDVGPESPELLEIARVELRETPEVREASFKELRELLKQNSDLSYRDDDDFLEMVLRCCHWYPESAIKLVSCASPAVANREKVEVFYSYQSNAKTTDLERETTEAILSRKKSHAGASITGRRW